MRAWLAGRRWALAVAANRLPGQCWRRLERWATTRRSGLPLKPQTALCHAQFADTGSCACGRLTQGGAS